MTYPALTVVPRNQPVRILIENGVSGLRTLGDVAMLQVAVKRLRQLWPDPSIQVLTSRPDLLRKYCPEVSPVSAAGRDIWMARKRHLWNRIDEYLPSPVLRALGLMEEQIVRWWPDLAENITRFKMRCKGESSPEMVEFLRAVKEADLVVLSGGGNLNDEFKSSAMTEVEILDMAVRRGAATVILGQGIGPIQRQHSMLNEKLQAVLPSVNLICLRERLLGPALLAGHGFNPLRICVTGDDAVEMAYSARALSWEKAIGINLRLATDSRFGQEDVATIQTVLQNAARRHRAPLRPLSMSLSESPSDRETIAQLLSGYEHVSGAENIVDTPADVIKQVAKCRLVVTGSYHAAVFALAQGRPAIGVAKSDYSMSKFLGLADQFGIGCTIVQAEGMDWSEKLADAIDRAWSSADEVRLPLIRAAGEQIWRGYAAYERLYDLVRPSPRGVRRERYATGMSRPGSSHI